MQEKTDGNALRKPLSSLADRVRFNFLPGCVFCAKLGDTRRFKFPKGPESGKRVCVEYRGRCIVLYLICASVKNITCIPPGQFKYQNFFRSREKNGRKEGKTTNSGGFPRLKHGETGKTLGLWTPGEDAGRERIQGPVKPMEKILQIPVKQPRSNKPGIGKDQSASCSRAWLSSVNPRATVSASSGLRPLRAAEKRSQAVSLNLAKWAWK